MKPICILGVLLLLTQTSCIVGGYSSDGGGWFFWPGGVLGLLVLVAVLFLLARRRDKTHCRDTTIAARVLSADNSKSREAENIAKKGRNSQLHQFQSQMGLPR